MTTVYVTHDQVEAMTMGDRVAVMKLGELQQVDSPLGLYDRPANLFVAGFIGSPQMNLLEAHAKDGQAQIGQYTVPVDPTASERMRGDITLGVRPEAWRIVSADEGGLPVRVTVVEELGSDEYVRHQRGRGHPEQHHHPAARPRHGAQGRHDPRHHRPPPRARSTPPPANASAGDGAATARQATHSVVVSL